MWKEVRAVAKASAGLRSDARIAAAHRADALSAPADALAGAPAGFPGGGAVATPAQREEALVAAAQRGEGPAAASEQKNRSAWDHFLSLRPRKFKRKKKAAQPE